MTTTSWWARAQPDAGAADRPHRPGGALLATATYKIRSGKRATLQLRQTVLGRKALHGLRKAQLRIDGSVRTVRIKH